MDIRFALGSISSYSLRPDSRNRNAFGFRPYCSRKDSKRQPEQNGNNDDDDRNGGDKFSTDWDKAWSSYRKRGKKTLFSRFSDKYVSWNPRRSDYPLSEEVDPIKRTEKSNLKLWTSQSFTLGGAILIVTLLLIYTILAPINFQDPFDESTELDWLWNTRGTLQDKLTSMAHIEEVSKVQKKQLSQLPPQRGQVKVEFFVCHEHLVRMVPKLIQNTRVARG